MIVFLNPKTLKGIFYNAVKFQGIVELNPAFRDYSERSEKVDKVLRDLRAKGLFSALKGWREEVSMTNQSKLVLVYFHLKNYILVL